MSENFFGNYEMVNLVVDWEIMIIKDILEIWSNDLY